MFLSTCINCHKEVVITGRAQRFQYVQSDLVRFVQFYLTVHFNVNIIPWELEIIKKTLIIKT